jgi:hypothetical protein
MPFHRYFNGQKKAVDFANETIENGDRAEVIPYSGNGPYEVEWSPVVAHVRAGRPVRASKRRVQKRLG